ncbi:hypothetical protein EJ06DRAFT_468209 [Trichodelitschia bisporula]|uniref:R3H domain-containing protein n=1 Tax=Trichodelitschia bisporula TaxID=703511 RepID=A0A6G1IB62_9PEZI|nr:hypothetical protein EJ06DRAFT_468209 [Trichodelitschia bisporula]
MSSPVTTPQPHNSRSRGRGRGGRNRPMGARQHEPATDDPPDGAEAYRQAAGTSGTAPQADNTPRGGRGNRRARGNAGRQTAHAPRMTAHGRQFGGQLTGPDHESHPSASAAGGQLQAEAPVFVPGQNAAASGRGRNAPNSAQPKKPRPPKSNAPDIATRTHEDIDNGHYECAVCTNEIFRNSKIWSCKLCWAVFHLTCVKKWSSTFASAMTQQQLENGEGPPSPQWRCPGCNLPQDTVPSSFTCWCGKEMDVKSSVGLPPFSCGQTCSRPHAMPKGCPHPCGLMCHAGPCPPCQQMAPKKSCFCGRETTTKRCVDTDYEHGWSCGQVCRQPMACGEHVCTRPCHEGACGACEVQIDARCYCGQVEKPLLCCDRADEKTSQRPLQFEDGEMITETWTGLFECGRTCDRLFDCGKHRCQEPCHVHDSPVPHCPQSPDVITTCSCGKTALSDLLAEPRKSCEDDIPACKKPCSKPLECGHFCKLACHTGDCLPCSEMTSISCRCGRIIVDTLCHHGRIEPPHCMKVCRVVLNCGRHDCGEHCCPGERKAVERQAATAAKRKQPLLGAGFVSLLRDRFEAEHICTRICGRMLKCGNHTCPALCHKGPCGNCREAIFEEIYCHCGKTVLQPPLPCGTQPPQCHHPCERPKVCGHPQVAHNCHLDNESCPKCPFLTTKPCLCGKNQLKNQPCWLQETRCGSICGRKLKCGFHVCRKQCHRPGECEDTGTHCTQLCGKEKSCGHACADICHSPFACKEDKPCQHKTYITCSCQRIKQETKCNATKNTEGNTTKSLKCDDECARLERNRKLALAFNIDPETHKDDHIPYQPETLKAYLANTAWAQAQEKELRAFAIDPDQKRLRFKPMKPEQRKFLHYLAEDFGFDAESMDPEPHRHIVVFKTPRFVMAPMKTLAECARIRLTQRTLAATTSVNAAEASKTVKASNLVDTPFNAFVISKTRFGLTIEELRSAIAPILSPAAGVAELTISFLPSEEVVVKPTPRAPSPSERAFEESLSALQPALAKVLTAQGLGSSELCRVDEWLNVLHREADKASSGWSQVAAKAAAGARRAVPLQGLGVKSSFTVLSTAASKKKKEKATGPRIVVEDDWEEAEMREEEKERMASAVNSGDENGGASASGSAPVSASGSARASFEDRREVAQEHVEN